MIGIDIVSIERITHFKERFGDKALSKFLTQDEIALVKNDATLAGFFAAKEAVSKAMGCGISSTCGFFDIRLYKDTLGAPYFTLSRSIIEMYGITDTSLSITHDKGFAIAVAVIEGKKEKRALSH